MNLDNFKKFLNLRNQTPVADVPHVECSKAELALFLFISTGAAGIIIGLVVNYLR